MAVHRAKFLIIKPTRCTVPQIYSWNETEFHPDPVSSCQPACMTYTIAVCAVKTPDDGQRNCPKHVEFHSKNKFEKLVHPVGFVIRTKHIITFRTIKKHVIRV